MTEMKDNFTPLSPEEGKKRAIRLAIDHAKSKWEDGKLISCNHPEYDKLMEDFADGDPDTVYSTALLFADDPDNTEKDWYDAILDALEKDGFGSYF